MEVLDPGHTYALDKFYEFKMSPFNFVELQFLKRNSGSKKHDGEYPGTNSQEVIRALIDRTKYLNDVLPCNESGDILYHLRMALYMYEVRAYRRKVEKVNRKAPDHNDELTRGHGENRDIPFTEYEIELLPTGPDGHIKL